MVKPANYFISAFLEYESKDPIGIIKVRMALFKWSNTSCLHLCQNKVFVIAKTLFD